MPRADRAATRQDLLRAGRELAGKKPLSALRIDDIVERAGVAKGTFYLHFHDRAELLVTLHREFHDEVERMVAEASAGLANGAERLLAGSRAYLDACRSAHPVKALLFEARVMPEILAEVGARNQRFAALAQKEFAAAGWPDPASAARLWVGLVAEAALAEAERGARLPRLRECLARFLE